MLFLVEQKAASFVLKKSGGGGGGGAAGPYLTGESSRFWPCYLQVLKNRPLDLEARHISRALLDLASGGPNKQGTKTHVPRRMSGMALGPSVDPSGPHHLLGSLARTLRLFPVSIFGCFPSSMTAKFLRNLWQGDQLWLGACLELCWILSGAEGLSGRVEPSSGSAFFRGTEPAAWRSAAVPRELQAMPAGWHPHQGLGQKGAQG